MNERNERILKHCNTSGRGLEIGPLFNPIAPKREGYDVEILDHKDRAGLIEKYRGHPDVPQDYEERIEEVDYVWRGERYPELVRGPYDYVVSAHLIEHIPDLIGHLGDICEILKDGGVYSIAVPDKRYSFDCRRQETTVAQMIARKGNTGYDNDLILDYYENVVASEGRIAWHKTERMKNLAPIYSREFVEEVRKDPQAFVMDFHVSVFTPRSFLQTMTELYERGEIPMPLLLVDEDTRAGEFFAVFQKGRTDNAPKLRAMPAWKFPYYRARNLWARIKPHLVGTGRR